MVLLIIAAVAVFLLGALLIFLVFLQNPKDQGGSSFSLGSGMQQMIGVAHASNVLERGTYVLAGLILVLTLFIAFRIEQRTERVTDESAIVTRLEKYDEQDVAKDEG